MSHKKSKMDEKNTKKSLSEKDSKKWLSILSKNKGDVHSALREWMNIKKGWDYGV